MTIELLFAGASFVVDIAQVLMCATSFAIGRSIPPTSRSPAKLCVASGTGAVVVLLAAQTDTTMAVLWTPTGITQIGRVAQDAEPAFAPGGLRGGLRTADGIKIFDAVTEPGWTDTSARAGVDSSQ